MRESTHTFPMYNFGQTSSTSLRCSSQESKTFCRSFTVRYSFLVLFDILPRLPVDYWSQCLFPSAAAQDDPYQQVFVCPGHLPNLTLCVVLLLQGAEQRTGSQHWSFYIFDDKIWRLLFTYTVTASHKRLACKHNINNTHKYVYNNVKVLWLHDSFHAAANTIFRFFYCQKRILKFVLSHSRASHKYHR